MHVFSHGPESFLFFLFASLAIVSGMMVIRARNPVHSVLFLILVFCNAAGLLLLLGLDFFAIIFLVVYVGAIAVLFLFVVMILNIKVAELNESLSRYLPIGGLIGVIFLCEIFAIVDNDLIPILQVPTRSLGIKDLVFSLDSFELLTAINALQEMSPFFVEWSSLQKPTSNIQALGQLIYTYYAYSFLVASLILLVAMIGAILLTMHKGVQVKRQEVFEQNTREYSKTLFMKKERFTQ